MVYLPHNVWDLRDVEGGGYILLFRNQDNKWYAMRVFADNSTPNIQSFTNKASRQSFVAGMPEQASEVYAQDFRVNWQPDGRISVLMMVNPAAHQG